jgi:hypothetical protein
MLSAIVRSTSRSAVRITTRRAGQTRKMGGGAMPYNEPGGNLFNETVAQRANRTWESWEYGYWSTCVAGLIFGTAGLAMKPDSSIKTWAEQEAKSRNAAGFQMGGATLGEEYSVTHGFKVSSIGAIPVQGGGGNDEDEDEDDE